MARIHIIVSHTDDKPVVLYIGADGTQADAAYETSKGVDTVEHYRYPLPSKRRGGDNAARQCVVRDHSETPVAAPKAKPAKV